MSSQPNVITVCDRCPGEKLATDTVSVCYDGKTYEIDVCDKHSEMFHRDMRGWLNLGREAKHQHGPKRWVPGERVASKKPARPLSSVPLPQAPPVVIDHDNGGVELRGDAATQRLDGQTSKVLSTGVQDADVDDDVDEWPRSTFAALDAAAELDLDWDDVLDQVDLAFATYVSPKREDVHVYLTPELSVLIADSGYMIGLAKRDTTQITPAHATTTTKKIVRKGKRGGQGRISLTIEQIVDAIRRTPGWSVDDTRPHYAVHGPKGQRCTIPKTNSDWRGPKNVLRDLRKIGLDLKAHAKAG